MSLQQNTTPCVTPAFQSGYLPWYAIRTKSNCEKPVTGALTAKGFNVFLPATRTRRRWSDRIVIAETPLFSGYLFCRFDAATRVPILSTPGVASIVGFNNGPAAVPEEQICAIHSMIESGLPMHACGFLVEGQRVRVNNGLLDNLEGILVATKSEYKVVVSIPLLQRSVSIEVDPVWITKLE